MTKEQQLKLQAYLDGELSGREARNVGDWLQDNREAAVLLAELKNTSQALAENEPQIKFPESREFYWSKIAREIQKTGLKRDSAKIFNWKRLLWPVSLAAGAIAVCFVIVISGNSATDRAMQAAVSADMDTPVVEPAQADSEAITYEIKSDGTTLVWFSADENVAPTKTF